MKLPFPLTIFPSLFRNFLPSRSGGTPFSGQSPLPGYLDTQQSRIRIRPHQPLSFSGSYLLGISGSLGKGKIRHFHDRQFQSVPRPEFTSPAETVRVIQRRRQSSLNPRLARQLYLDGLRTRQF